uniref:Uncharacterized protein n=1 Tax=uncultured bacterium 9F08 TaxID=697051 RepID=D2XIT2_9BACT|nr:hypothetical protein [uncultured bacterium 9F08]
MMRPFLYKVISPFGVTEERHINEFGRQAQKSFASLCYHWVTIFSFKAGGYCGKLYLG